MIFLYCIGISISKINKQIEDAKITPEAPNLKNLANIMETGIFINVITI